MISLIVQWRCLPAWGASVMEMLQAIPQLQSCAHKASGSGVQLQEEAPSTNFSAGGDAIYTADEDTLHTLDLE